MNTVGERIFKLRKDKKLSREFLGEKIGVSKTAIKNWEDGENSPKVEFLESLAKYFNVDFNWLVTGSGETNTLPKPAIRTAIDDRSPSHRWFRNEYFRFRRTHDRLPKALAFFQLLQLCKSFKSLKSTMSNFPNSNFNIPAFDHTAPSDYDFIKLLIIGIQIRFLHRIKQTL